MRALNLNCKDCGIEKNRDNTYTYTDTRSGVLRTKARCIMCDKKIITNWVKNNPNKHNKWSRESMKRRKVKLISNTPKFKKVTSIWDKLLNALKSALKRSRIGVGMILTAGLILTSCEKEEICFDSAKIYVEYDNVKQEFNDGTVVVLGIAGEEYAPYNNTCEL